jgi:uncharacterized protein
MIMTTEYPETGPSEPAPRIQSSMTTSDERTWAMLAHLSVLANLVTGFLGPVAALVIYLVYKDRSRYVAYHALQSTINQLIWWVGGGALIGVIWAVTGMLSLIIIGLLCVPFSLLLTILILAMPLISLVYGVVGAIEVNQGRDFRYWLVGDWVRGTLVD